jgi:hypothetical protein
VVVQPVNAIQMAQGTASSLTEFKLTCVPWHLAPAHTDGLSAPRARETGLKTTYHGLSTRPCGGFAQCRCCSRGSSLCHPYHNHVLDSHRATHAIGVDRNNRLLGLNGNLHIYQLAHNQERCRSYSLALV